MKMIFKAGCTVLSFTILVLTAIPSVSAADNKAIQIKGSDTMVNLGQAWTEEFMRLHPDANIAVTGGGSGTGISAIIAGTCDIAQSSRDIKEEEVQKAKEAGYAINTFIAGYDGIAIITHTSNPVVHLTMDQLADIFTGKIKNWKDLGGKDRPILVLSRERNSGTHVFFLEHVLRKGNVKGPEEFVANALMMPSSQAIIQEVQGSESAIGYVGLGYVSKQVKLIPIAKDAVSAAIIPTIDTVQSNEYPISRTLLFFTRGEPQGFIKEYIDFVLSPEGQEIVRLLDFVPLKQ